MSKADQTYMRNLIRSLESKLESDLILINETKMAIITAEKKLEEITPKVYQVRYNCIQVCWEVQEEYCHKNDRWSIIKAGFMFRDKAELWLEKHKEKLRKADKKEKS